MIGGNVTATIQAKTTSRNEYGALTDSWKEVTTVKGFLDYSGGDGSYKSDFKGDLAETTHIFICDFNSTVAQATATLSRLIIDNKIYDVLMIDDPMNLHKHIEIILKYNEVVN